MAANLGDIEKAKKGGRFIVYINGVDSRLEKDPIVKACPFVFWKLNFEFVPRFGAIGNPAHMGKLLFEPWLEFFNH